MRERMMGLVFTIRERTMGWELKMRNSDGVRVHHQKEGWEETSP